MLAALLVLGAACRCGCNPARLLPPSVPGKPYVSFVEQVQGFDVWRVDGQYVRENLDEEFTNFGQHLEFKFIPNHEFWLDAENAPGETPFFVAHLLEENRLMAGGMPYDRALDKADEVERAARLASGPGSDAKALLESGRGAELMARVHETLLPDWSDGVKVWVVDGELVRDAFFIDLTEGGHDKVYKFVPANEVWIDDDIKPRERRFILLHELHERALMAKGWPYAKAHRDSSRLERRYRLRSAGLDAALRAEMAKNRP